DGMGSLHVTASLGAATLPGSADDMRGLFAAADEALYRAKRAGKKRTERAEASPRLEGGYRSRAMGLLDDAIREHLELKRRHGADPSEVSRQACATLGARVGGECAKPAGAEDGADEPAAV